jgi:hypothetical protein
MDRAISNFTMFYKHQKHSEFKIPYRWHVLYLGHWSCYTNSYNTERDISKNTQNNKPVNHEAHQIRNAILKWNSDSLIKMLHQMFLHFKWGQSLHVGQLASLDTYEKQSALP